MGHSFETVVVVVVSLLGIAYTVIQTFSLSISVEPKMKNFITIENKSKIALNTIIVYLFLLIGAIYYINEYYKAKSNLEKNIYLGFTIFCCVSLVIFLILLSLRVVKETYNAYYILDGKLFKLRLIEDDLVYLISIDSEHNMYIKNKEFLFENKHIILNKKELESYKNEHKYLFEDS
ncbi:hypothetical protein [Listeria seeligeri]|uniref:hypothetical protein n=1 Tax=Listeria seeligeri TaxID=1640 RepID=UPI002F410224